MKTVTIEEKAKKQEPKFLDAKKIVFIVLALLLLIGLIAITFVFVLKDFSFQTLFDGIKTRWNGDRGRIIVIALVICLVLFFFIKFFQVSVPYMIRLKKMGIKTPFKEAVLYYLTTAFLTAISPGVLLTEPYNMFWLRTRGITTAQATALVWINEFLYHTVLMFITLPAFIYFTTQFGGIIQTYPAEGTTVVILACVGVGIDVLMFAFYIFSGFSKKVHYYLSRIFNRTKQLFHMKYHTKNQTYETYIRKAVLFNNAKILLKDYKENLIIAACFIFTTLLWFLMMYASLILVNAGSNEMFDFVQFLKVMATVSVVTTANRYLPIPGGEGMIQMQMQIMLMFEHQDSTNWPPSGIDNGIFVWRSFTAYIPAIVGVSGFIIYLVGFAKAAKHKQTFLQK